MKETLGNPKLAIIGPKFFGYLERISIRFTERGIPTQFFDELPSNSITAKIFIRSAPISARQRFARKYHEGLYQKLIESKVTHVLLVTIEVLPIWFVRELRSRGVQVYRYAWDSVANKPIATTFDDVVLKTASFDPQDCQAYGYDYIPLFSEIDSTDIDGRRPIDFFYCATFHSRRPQWVNKLFNISFRHGWSTHFFLFYRSKRLWLIRYFLHPRLWPLVRQISTTAFATQAIADETRAAKVVIDLHHHRQSGLTMRTFEALSLGAVVLSTNPHAYNALPVDIRERLVVFDEGNAAERMAEALTRPTGNISEDARHFLSCERFICQLEEFMDLRGASPQVAKILKTIPYNSVET